MTGARMASGAGDHPSPKSHCRARQNAIVSGSISRRAFAMASVLRMRPAVHNLTDAQLASLRGAQLAESAVLLAVAARAGGLTRSSCPALDETEMAQVRCRGVRDPRDQHAAETRSELGMPLEVLWLDLRLRITEQRLESKAT